MIIGHQKITDFLTGSIKSGRLAHAYLFVGPSQVGKKTVALEFIKNLQCQKPKNSSQGFSFCGECESCQKIEKDFHPDILKIEAGGQALLTNESDDSVLEKSIKNQEIKIEQIRQLQHQVNLSPFFAPCKAVIIDGAEQMTQEAANCLLKTLEEPPPKSLLILISSNWQRLLPTIISRCQLIKFSSVKSDLILQGFKKLGFGDDLKTRQAVKFAGGRPGAAINFLKDTNSGGHQEQAVKELKKILEKDLVEKFKFAQKLSQNIFWAQRVLGDWLIWFRDQMLLLVGVSNLGVFNEKSALSGYSLSQIRDIIKNIQEAQILLAESGFNARLILENLMIKI